MKTKRDKFWFSIGIVADVFLISTSVPVQDWWDGFFLVAGCLFLGVSMYLLAWRINRIENSLDIDDEA